ncbi:hypothetical protein T4B_4186 [Trichinella pseudospiralis]|uniref:Uncharacterized protein n=1 Tax=Trichinella pseudospiralis TaxID=6337 RepID=A0A0V1IPN0_TRIPS|nr:hypothetical protein T4A_6574 [Trichinella pseudospiralis]KRZ24763.1 hypothetical protein T4B_4186 [Trichinella pseudospiralis]KRZ38097.1 hypothetical protein T4C_7496 [Trichinella pseudospiralis]
MDTTELYTSKQILENWLNSNRPDLLCSKKTITVHECSERVVQARSRLARMSEILKEMNPLCTIEGACSEWEALQEEAESIRMNFDSIMTPFYDPNTWHILCSQIQKRIKRRARNKRKAVQIEDSSNSKYAKQELAHLPKNTSFQKEMMNAKEHQSPNTASLLQKQLHIVRSYLRLVDLLGEFRSLKLQNASKTGAELDSGICNANFEHKKTALVKSLESLENHLKCLLLQGKGVKCEINNKEKLTALFKKLLFNEAVDDHDRTMSTQTLFQRRKAWDRFVVSKLYNDEEEEEEENSFCKASIPMAEWILPPYQSKWFDSSK